MRKFSQHLVSFLKNEDGPTAVEYAVMLALIIVVCITAITTLGTNANNTFSYVGTKVGKHRLLKHAARPRIVSRPNRFIFLRRRMIPCVSSAAPGQFPEERRRPDRGRVRRHAGPDHRGVHHRHHDPGHQRQQHLQLRRQPGRRHRLLSELRRELAQRPDRVWPTASVSRGAPGVAAHCVPVQLPQRPQLRGCCFHDISS